MSYLGFSHSSDDDDPDDEFDVAIGAKRCHINEGEEPLPTSPVGCEGDGGMSCGAVGGAASSDHMITLVVDYDDGWISNEEKDDECSNVVDYQAQAEAIKDEWIKEEKKSTPHLVQFIASTFNESDDPYEIVLEIIRRAGKTRPHSYSIYRLILSQFLIWKRDEAPPPCSPAHQLQAIKILEHCHHVYFDDIMTIFSLHLADRGQLVAMVMSLLDSYRHTDALTYIIKLKLQKEFDVIEMLLPLMAMDKIIFIEDYLEPHPDLQHQFLSYIEMLYSNPVELEDAVRHTIKLGIAFSITNTKLTHHQLEKLAIRLANKYNIPLRKYPKIFENKAVSSINYLLYKKYIKKSLADDSLLEIAVKDRLMLQYHLVMELVNYNDLSLAGRFALLYNLSHDGLPPALVEYLNDNNSKGLELTETSHDNGSIHPSDCYLSLPSDVIISFVSDEGTLKKCRDTLIKANNIIGIDSEWVIPLCIGGMERLSILQLAVKEIVFILDVVMLLKQVHEDILMSFIRELFGSDTTLKLGYQIQSDLMMLYKTWPFTRPILTSAKRVVDLKSLSDEIFTKDCKYSQLSLTSYIPSPGEPRQYVSSIGRGIPMKGGTSLATPSGGSGLNQLVHKCIGKPLDKSFQFSNWERRPLLDGQLQYADAHCLLQVYEYMKDYAKDRNLTDNIEPTIGCVFKKNKSKQNKV